MGVWMDYVRRKAERWQQTWGEAALAASEKQEPLTLGDVYLDRARMAEVVVEYWKQRYADERKEHEATRELHERCMSAIEAVLHPMADVGENRLGRILANMQLWEKGETTRARREIERLSKCCDDVIDLMVSWKHRAEESEALLNAFRDHTRASGGVEPVEGKNTASAAGIDFSRLQATCIKSDGTCWQCAQLRQLIDALVWDTAEYLNHAGQWAPTGTLTCHFCGVVKGHPHSETCRAKGIGE